MRGSFIGLPVFLTCRQMGFITVNKQTSENNKKTMQSRFPSLTQHRRGENNRMTQTYNCFHIVILKNRACLLGKQVVSAVGQCVLATPVQNVAARWRSCQTAVFVSGHLCFALVHHYTWKALNSKFCRVRQLKFIFETAEGFK